MGLLLDMNAMSSFDELKETIRESFQEQGITSCLIGIIFAPPTAFFKSEISDSIEYFHYRSSDNINFFWAGYELTVKEDSKKLCEINNNYWKFNPEKFNEIRDGFEKETTWVFSGESDFILFSAKINEIDSIDFDFTDAIIINLEKAKTEKAISSVRNLFENVFGISQKIKTENSPQILSKKLIAHSGKKMLFPLLIACLPKRFQEDINTVYTFCTDNIKKKTNTRL